MAPSASTVRPPAPAGESDGASVSSTRAPEAVARPPAASQAEPASPESFVPLPIVAQKEREPTSPATSLTPAPAETLAPHPLMPKAMEAATPPSLAEALPAAPELGELAVPPAVTTNEPERLPDAAVGRSDRKNSTDTVALEMPGPVTPRSLSIAQPQPLERSREPAGSRKAPARAPSAPTDAAKPTLPVDIPATTSTATGPLARPDLPSPVSPAKPADLMPQESLPGSAPPTSVPSTRSAEAPRSSPEVGPLRSADRPTTSGLGLGLVRIELDGAAQRSTSKGVETVAGTIFGGANVETRIEFGETAQSLHVQAGRFQFDVPLKRGLNHVRVVGTNPQGGSAEATVTIDYAPPPVPNGIAIIAPVDGATLGSDDPPIMIVRGRVEDPEASSVAVIVNQVRFEVPVRDGVFEAPVPIMQPVVHLVAEARGGAAATRRSAAVTVHAASGASTTAVLFIDWPSVVPGDARGLRASWRGRPDRLEGPTDVVSVQRFPLPVERSRAIYYVRRMRPGAYTFVVDGAVGQSHVPAGATLFVPVAGAMTMRPLKNLRPNAAGRITLAKLLMPLGVLWDEDDWVIGRSQGPDTITKFNANGVSWTERRGDLR